MNNIKLAILSLSMAALSACKPSATEKVFEVMPPELADCRTYNISNGLGDNTIVMRCPGSDTSLTYHQGKATRSTVVIDKQ